MTQIFFSQIPWRENWKGYQSVFSSQVCDFIIKSTKLLIIASHYLVSTRGRHERYASKFGYRWVPSTSRKKNWVPMGTAYRPDKKCPYQWVLGTSKKKNFGDLWVPCTGQIKKLCVPVRTRYRPNFYSCRPLVATLTFWYLLFKFQFYQIEL